MATKKLSPKAEQLANPPAKIKETNPSKMSERYATDARNPKDQDGNEEHARARRASPPPEGGSVQQRARPRK